MSVPFDAMYRKLAESLAITDKKAYVLIDPILGEPFTTSFMGAEDCQSHTIPINRDVLDETQKPRLIELHPKAVGLLRASLQLAIDEQSPVAEAKRGFAIAGWLLSDQPIEVVKRHLSRMMLVRQPGIGRRYVRLADRRVLEWLWPTLKRHQQAILMGPIAEWKIVDRCGQFITYQSPDTPPPHVPLELSPKQWHRLEQCATAQVLLREWSGFAENGLPSDYLKQVERLLNRFASIGLTEEADILLLAVYALQLHPHLDKHPAVRRAIVCSQQQQIPLADELGKISDPDGWEQIRDELNNKGALHQAQT